MPRFALVSSCSASAQLRVLLQRLFQFALAALLLCVPMRVVAQTGLATLSGTVTDATGAVLPKANLTVTNEDTHVVSKTRSNGAGVYVIEGLIPGRYRLLVEHEGFKQIEVEDIELHTQDIVSRNFNLPVGATSETIQVNGSGININTTDAAVSTVIDRQFVANMPLNGRSFQDLLTLAPGVATTPSGTGFSGGFTVNGQRTESNYFTVDGVSANVGTAPGQFGAGAGFGGGTPAETALGTTQSVVSVDALQEFRASTSTYSAEYGRTPGGQFSFTTRSGTNDWHGSAFDYFRNEAFDANNWFNNAAAPQVPREKERQNDFGGTLGGPVRIPHLYNGKDRTFFFFSYEGLRLWTPQGLVTLSVPDESLRQQAPAALLPLLKAFPLPNGGEDGLNDGLGIYQVGSSYPSSIDAISVRADHNFADRFRVFGRVANTPTVTSSYNGAIKNNSTINNRLLTLGATTVLSTKQSNEFRFNITQSNSVSSSVSTSLGGATPFDVTTLPGPNGSSFPTGGSWVGLSLAFGGFPSFAIQQVENSQRQYNVTDSHSWNIGLHSFKFGIDWRRLATPVTPILIKEVAGFANEAAVLANNVGSDGVVVVQSKSPAPVEPAYTNFSAFVEDEWKATMHLSLSFGMRWDVDPAPSNLAGPSPYTLDQITNLATAQLAPAGTPLWKTDWGGFAPRVGAAYQLHRSSGRETVLRGGFGVFYDMGNTVGSQGFNGIGFQSQAVFNCSASNPTCAIGFPLSSAQLTLPPPNIVPPYGGTVYAFDPNLKLPYTLQWNVAVQQALGSGQSVEVSYVGSSGRRLLESFNYSPAGNPNFSTGCECLQITKTGPTSNYNALQLKFQRSLLRGLQVLASYTLSHSIDDASSNFDSFDLLERASSDFDVRHNLQTALTYDVPGHYSSPVLSGLLKYWSLDVRVTARSALPVDIIGTSAINPVTGGFLFLHPNLVPGQPLYLYGSAYPGGKIIDYNTFSVPSSGVGPGGTEEGNTPRNYARDFPAWQLNLAVRREFPIFDRLHLQFRAEAFNALNHPSFSGVNAFWQSGPFDPNCLACGFGTATNTLNNTAGSLNALYAAGGPRSLQLALKLIF